MPPRRKCVPNADRDAYVSHRRLSGKGEVSVRITERYIDDFLRYCDEEFGFTNTKQVSAKHVTAFADSQKSTYVMKDTARLKIREVLKWLEWLASEGVLNRNPAADLDASHLAP